jgi:uncharacterized protein (DUF1330 family)
LIAKIIIIQKKLYKFESYVTEQSSAVQQFAGNFIIRKMDKKHPLCLSGLGTCMTMNNEVHSQSHIVLLVVNHWRRFN